MKKLLTCAACSILLASTFLAAQVAPSDVLTGDPIFQKNCVKCHGKTAEGRHFRGPSLLSEKVFAASVGDLRGIVTNGKGRMPKFGAKLSAGEIDHLVEQLKAAAKK